MKCAWILAALLVALPASADDLTADARDAARRSYEEGVRATEVGDYATAARAFARADSLAPNATALEAALESALRADAAAVGMELVARAEARPDVAAKPIVGKARAAFASRAGRVVVACDEPCRVDVDGAPLAERTAWLTVGAHRVRAVSGDDAIEKTIEVGADAEVRIDLRASEPDARPTPAALPAPLSTSEPAEASSFVASPIVFFVGAGATLVLGGVAVGAFISSENTYAEFEDAKAGFDGSSDELSNLRRLASEGESAEDMTRVFVAAGAAMAVGTTLLGVFVTDWGESTEVALGPAGARLRARF